MNDNIVATHSVSANSVAADFSLRTLYQNGGKINGEI